ncbi:hypothetical protein ACH5RR_004292 [Cinchona calisaya]|uniref:RanBP2-type domain-containing protein n=1 Tax=Cinchona calisaya TaxID=153742 RepID=A0ABD3AXA8_9GENT
MSSREGDWVCAACQHSNFKRRDACQKCGCPKYASPADISAYRINRTEVLPGDWYCTGMNCGAHNYASRTSCYRCGALKGADYCQYGVGMVAPGGYLYDPSALPGWKTGDWICTGLIYNIHSDMDAVNITMLAGRNATSAKCSGISECLPRKK